MAAFHTGLTSVTFRQKSAAQIAALAAEAGLEGIEWGGDIHVPPGDTAAAASAARLTREAGLRVTSYGSYYHALPQEDFAPVLQSAAALGAPVVRIWAGDRPWEQLSEAERETLAASVRDDARDAAREGIALSFEYHRGTATQTRAGALALLEAVGEPNVRTYWQPNPDITQGEQLAEIDCLLPYLSHIHVFTWTGANIRHPLAEGEARWQEYLSAIRRAGGSRFLLMEFVRDDSEADFLADAAVLRRWAEEENQKGESRP